MRNHSVALLHPQPTGCLRPERSAGSPQVRLPEARPRAARTLTPWMARRQRCALGDPGRCVHCGEASLTMRAPPVARRASRVEPASDSDTGPVTSVNAGSAVRVAGGATRPGAGRLAMIPAAVAGFAAVVVVLGT